MKPEAKLIAAAILGAGALIGAGLFWGLRASAPSPTQASAPPPVDDSSVQINVPTGPVSASRSEAPPVPTQHAPTDEAVRAAIAKQHATLRDKCWAPAKPNETASVRVRFLFQRGKQTALSVEDLAAYPSLSDCLRGALTPIEAPDGGGAVATQVSVRFP